ncbi:sigma-54 interaction domain-containing protein [Clostridium sp. DL1XJH146]
MKKSITIIDYNFETIKVYIDQLKTTFEDKLHIKGILANDISEYNVISTDVIVISSYYLYSKIKKHMNSKSKIIIIERTITKEAYLKLIDFKDIYEEDKVYLIDETKDMARDMSFVIRKLIKSNIEIIPCSFEDYEKIESGIIISLGYELKNTRLNILDIGTSMMSIGTIIEIGVDCNLMKMLKEKDVLNAYKEMISYNKSLMYLVNRTNSYEGIFKSFFDNFDKGYLIFDTNGNIEDYNKEALQTLKLENKDVDKMNISDLISTQTYTQVFEKKEILKDEIIKIEGKNIVLSAYPTINSGRFYGATIIIKEFGETEKRQHEIRKKIIGKGHIAKYRFEDIIGESICLKESILKAKRMSFSNSSILIEGETGTGKELFAQAIHNHSPRKNYQFVAVNFASLPGNILESELFGYEEGAFTGAKKGGKTGLFELAHKGTIFLDEIGEIPMNLQVKLLRVLQEKEVMRLGGDKIISVDIRVIAATNRNLYDLVKVGSFRRDLFYRLKVLPLKLPPLRNRKEDILVILEFYKKYFNGKYSLSNEAKDKLLNYEWLGNIRELRNFAEYFINIEKSIIDIEDLPIEGLQIQEENYYYTQDDREFIEEKNSYGKNENYTITPQHIKNQDFEKIEVKELVEISGSEREKYIYILNILYQNYTNNRRMGRRSISNLAIEKGFPISEQEVRRILNHLEKYDYVKKNIGRKGSEISLKGIKVMSRMGYKGV